MENTILSQDFSVLIEKHLPGQVSVPLQKVLKQGEQDAKELAKLKELYAAQSAEIHNLQKQLSEHTALDAKLNKLQAETLKLEEDTRNAKIAELTYQLDAEKDKTAFSKELALSLTRNAEYRKSIFDTENQMPYYEGQNYIQPTPVNKSLTETISQQ